MLNHTLLMSGAEYFSDEFAINPYYLEDGTGVDNAVAIEEHRSVLEALEGAGARIIKVGPPKGCQDGVYTANWGLCRGDTCVLSSLPNKRQAEEAYADRVLKKVGKKTIKAPYKFSGQGDALPCGNLLFAGSMYRTDPRMHQFLAETLGYKVIGLQTVPTMDANGQPTTNVVTGWPDSFFYDIDLAISVLREDLIAWCPEAFLPESQEKIRSLSLNKIEVSLEEATQGFACNLVSTGQEVIMGNKAPQLAQAIEAHGLKVTQLPINELARGGGYIRCITLTLDNK